VIYFFFHQNFIIQKKRIKSKIEQQLLPNQKKFVDQVAKYFATMNVSQIGHSLKEIQLDLNKIKVNTPIQLYSDIQLNGVLENISNPNPKNLLNHKELLVTLSKWFIDQNPAFGLGSTVNGENTVKSKEKEDKKETKELKAEKEIYDLELTGFEAAKKIGLIKEVRTLTNLGLKEVYID